MFIDMSVNYRMSPSQVQLLLSVTYLSCVMAHKIFCSLISICNTEADLSVQLDITLACYWNRGLLDNSSHTSCIFLEASTRYYF